MQFNPIQSNPIQSNAMQCNANQQEESMNSSGVSHSVTHLDHGSIVQYPGSLQLVQEFGLDSVTSIVVARQSFNRSRIKIQVDGWMTYVDD